MEKVPGDVARYNDIIQHETLRVAVIGMIDNDFRVTMPEPLHEAMEKSFLQFYEFYECTAQKKMHLNGQQMQDPFGDKRGTFQYATLLKRLKNIYARLKPGPTEESASSTSTPDSTD